jgi:aminopeptidase N
MRFFVRMALTLLVPVMASAQTASPDPGIALELADARAERIRDLRYDLRLTIPAQSTQPIEGSTRISLALTTAADPLVIDFATSREHVKSVSANGQDTPVQWTNGHIVVPAAALTSGRNTIEIAFRAGDASLNRNADFLYALFVPARAHLAIPVFDQPNLKARWTLTLSYPGTWVAVSNGQQQGSATITIADGSGPNGPPTHTVTFAETEPLPTYLFSFVAGDFKVESAERNGRTMRMFHRETDAKKV